MVELWMPKHVHAPAHFSSLGQVVKVSALKREPELVEAYSILEDVLLCTKLTVQMQLWLEV